MPTSQPSTSTERSTKFTTHYIGHDPIYQRHRQNPDYVGWETAEDFAKTVLRWDRLRQWSTFPKSGNVLELGCGAGNVSLYLAEHGYHVAGVDIAPTAIAWAKENAASAGVDAHFQVDDVCQLATIAAESFDIVLDAHCLHCIIGEDRTAALQNAWRVLKVGGTLAIETMCNEPPDSDDFRQHFDPVSRCMIRNGVATRYIGDSNDILGEIMAAGFRIRQMELVPPYQSPYDANDIDLADLVVVAVKD